MTYVLDNDFLYPLYKPDEQSLHYKMGHITHKRPCEMTRHERRRVAKFQGIEHKERDHATESR